MPLDDASPTKSFSDDASPSNTDNEPDSGDAWSTLRRSPTSNITHTTTLPSYINLRDFPRPCPIPLLSQSRAWNDEHIVRTACKNAAALSQLAQRRLTRPEWEAVTFHCAKMNAIASYGFPLGASLAWWRCYSMRAKWTFPFYTPKMEGVHEGGTFNPRTFANGLLTGRWAELQWQSLRFMSYGFLGGVLGSLLFVSYGNMSAAGGQMVDDRMGDLMSFVKEEAQKTRDDMMGQRNQKGEQRQRRYPVRESDKERIEEEDEQQREPDLQGLARRADERRQMEARDAPKSVEYGAGAGGLYDEDGVDDASPSVGTRPSQPPASDANAWQRIRQDRSRQPRQPPSYQPAQQSPQPERNAWMERRRESASSPQQPGAGTREDSFSFSSSEQDKQLAKEEAQKAFDARVERERQGRDFVDDASPTTSGRWK
ncbi:MAG: hypothetical protein M1828_000728 [Chrysothrix sp. TS-e1954]|nr:MAG: hypothetical protein M1828_000728 [Chrysothrix sp. TS-e1954]